ncbi:MAG: hypothetical protein M3P44_07275, partial [Actinomycetota bacterium]|nr:hypothetical protein [Actinomycetota bacterium]
MPPVTELTGAPARVATPTLPRVAARRRVALAVLALTALSFLTPSAPTYDPWAWIVWGREVLHLDLSTTGGPSWKPLPVLLTTPFALFGPLAPDLWLFVARAGALAGVVLAFRVARRLGGGTVGATAAATAYALAPWTVRNAAMGNSEGLLVALALGAVDRHVVGARGQAFALGLGCALLRPEAWPLFGLYGLWLLWRDRRAALGHVLAGWASLPVLWLLPELWGSGDPLRAAHRAHAPNADSAAFADNPVAEVLRDFANMIQPVVWAGVAVFALVMLAHRRTSHPSRREARVALALGVIAVIWVAEVAYMTNDGFSGNARYLIMPAAIVCVLGGLGLGWLIAALARLRLAAGPGAIALVVLAALAVGVPAAADLPDAIDSIGYQSRLTDGVGPVIERAGGPAALRRCGDAYTGPFQVPVVAWHLRVHTSAVNLHPAGPAVVFRAANA